MKSVLLAMSDLEHDKRTWRSSAFGLALVLLTLASHTASRTHTALLRHAYADSSSDNNNNNNNNNNPGNPAAAAVDADSNVFTFTAGVAVAQLITAAVVLRGDTLRGDSPPKEALVVLAFAHLGGVFMWGYVTQLDHAAAFGSGASAWFVEPLLTLTALWIVTSVAERAGVWLCVALISSGCLFASVRPTVIAGSDRTSLVCALSAFVLALRNITARQLVAFEGVVVKARGASVLTGLVACSVGVLLLVYLLLSPLWLALTLCAAASCGLSAATLLVTLQLLTRQSAVLVSLLQLGATLLEALLLTPSDLRPDAVVGVLALLVAAFGVYLYVGPAGAESRGSATLTGARKPANSHEQLTRTEFLLFTSGVLGVIFYVFQPRVSQRDLNTLSYVGLDKVLRRLLSWESRQTT